MIMIDEIINDPVKLPMLIILAVLEIPAIVFLTWAWFDAKRKYKKNEKDDT